MVEIVVHLVEDRKELGNEQRPVSAFRRGLTQFARLHMRDCVFEFPLTMRAATGQD